MNNELIHPALLEAVLEQRQDPVLFNLKCEWERAYQSYPLDWSYIYETESKKS